ncbi:hypothetical protein [Arthrobacter sp. NPDC056493]|uniref:hypothetical protein n=1 Tax=Arthrobacter sp. NPDC056493 TaxID=3345839 RepID=UPI003670B98C
MTSPGAIVEIEIAFHPGEQLCFVISSPNLLGTLMPAIRDYVGTNTGRHVIHSGGQHVSYLQLPIRALKPQRKRPEDAKREEHRHERNHGIRAGTLGAPSRRHTLLVIVWNMLHDGVAYDEPGIDHNDNKNPERARKRLQRRILALGFEPNLMPISAGGVTFVFLVDRGNLICGSTQIP